MILLLKATIPAPVRVAGYLRGRVFIVPHVAIRHKAIPAAEGTIARTRIIITDKLPDAKEGAIRS